MLKGSDRFQTSKATKKTLVKKITQLVRRLLDNLNWTKLVNNFIKLITIFSLHAAIRYVCRTDMVKHGGGSVMMWTVFFFRRYWTTAPNKNNDSTISI